MKTLSPSERGEIFTVPTLDPQHALTAINELRMQDNPGLAEQIANNAIAQRPVNAYTGNPYQGINIGTLLCAATERGYKSQDWATLIQWNKLGAKVRKGEKGNLIVKYEEFEKVVDHKTVKSAYRKPAYVFNREQLKATNDSTST